jgi:hypothetical protein
MGEIPIALSIFINYFILKYPFNHLGIFPGLPTVFKKYKIYLSNLLRNFSYCGKNPICYKPQCDVSYINYVNSEVIFK